MHEIDKPNRPDRTIQGGSEPDQIPLVISKLEDPFPHLSPEQRREAIAALGKRASDIFTASVTKVEELIRTYNPLQLLAHPAYYDLIHQSKDSEHYSPIQQASVEWLQAMILRMSSDKIGTILQSSPNTDQYLQLNQILGELAEAYTLKGAASAPRATESEVIFGIRNHTAFVRNEGFPSQIQRSISELFLPLDSKFAEREGYSLTDVGNFLWGLIGVCEAKLKEDKKQRLHLFTQTNVQSLLAEFQKLTGIKPEAVRQGMGADAEDIAKLRFGISNKLGRS
jgi:hypothetical protein